MSKFLVSATPPGPMPEEIERLNKSLGIGARTALFCQGMPVSDPKGDSELLNNLTQTIEKHLALQQQEEKK